MAEGTKIAIWVGLERVGPMYTDSKVTLSVNLTAAHVGAVEGTQDELKSLYPWRWGTITKLHLFPVADGRLTGDRVVIDLEYPDATAVGDRHWGSVEEYAKRQLEPLEPSARVAAMGWRPTADSSSVVDASAWHIRAYLAYLSTLPAPLPHALQLAGTVGIMAADFDAAFADQDDVERGWIAAPEIVEARGARHVPAAPQWTEAGLEWPYVRRIDDQQEGNTSYVAYPNVLQRGAVESLWVTPPDPWLDPEWHRMLPQRLAATLDLAAWTLEIGQWALAQWSAGHPSPERQAWDWLLRPFSDVVLTLLRDRANLAAGVVGRMVEDVDSLRAQRPTDFAVRLRDALRDADANVTAETWRATLRAVAASTAPPLARRPTTGDAELFTLASFAEELAELRRVHALLQTRDGVRAVVTSQWQQALAAEYVRLGVDADLQVLARATDLGTFFADALLGRNAPSGGVPEESDAALLPWRAFLATPRDTDAEWVTAVLELLRAYYQARLATDGDGAPASAFAHTRAWKPALNSGNRVLALVDRVLSDAIAAGEGHWVCERVRRGLALQRGVRDANGGRTPTATPHDLGLCVDDVAGEPPVGSDDRLRRYAGVGVLVRQRYPDPDRKWSAWRSACIASMKLGEGDFVHVLAAHRLPYVDGARTATIAYDGDPLIAPSPLVEYARGVEKTEVRQFIPIAEAELADQADTQWTKWGLLPALSFGQELEFAVHYIGVAGALPKELAPVHPAQLSSEPPLELPQDVVRKIRYLRRVPLGAPRVVAYADVAQMEVPADVLPLARELQRDGVATRGCRRVYGWDALELRGMIPLPGPDEPLRLLLRAVRLSEVSAAPRDGRAASFRVAICLQPEHETHDATEWLVFSVEVAHDGAPRYGVKLVGETETSEIIDLPDGAEAHDFELDFELDCVSNENGKWSAVASVAVRRRDQPAHYIEPVKLDRVHIADPPRPFVHIETVIDDASEGQVTFEPPTIVAPEGVSLSDNASAPLVLLGHGAITRRLRHEFAATLRLPSVCIDTWDKWVARDEWWDRGDGDKREAWRQYRAKVIDQVHKAAAAEERFLDDPAAAPLLFAELVLIESPEGVRNPSAGACDVPYAGDVAHRVPWDPGATCLLEVRLVAGGGTQMEFAPGRIRVSLPQGCVADLRVHAAVANTWFDDTDGHDQRFSGGLFGPGATRKLEDGREFVLGPPISWRIETISAIDPDVRLAEALWAALSPALIGRRAAVRLRPSAALAERDGLDRRKLAAAFRLLGTIEVRRQMWRWDGRPLAAFPFDAEDADAETRCVWDVDGFGHRDDTDVLVHQSRLRLAPTATEIYARDLSDDPRMTYHRFAAIAYSRYRGVLVDPRGVEALEHEGPAASPPSWRRLVVPALVADVVPKPVVRVVLPLTEASVSAQSCASLLVVVAEPWFELGGLAETLVAEVCVAEHDALTKPLRELGADPIVFTPPEPDNPEDPPRDGLQELAERFEWNAGLVAVGHTLDTDSSAPRFSAASFVLDPPTDMPGNRWPMAKVRFRRRLLAAGCSDGLVHESDWTAPVWVQFLPASNPSLPVEQQFPTPFAALRVKLTDRAPTAACLVEIREGVATPTSFGAARHDPQAERTFHSIETWMLLTRKVVDVHGRADREAYVALLSTADHETWTRWHGADAAPGAEVVARLLQIQSRAEWLVSPLQVADREHQAGRYFDGRRQLELPLERPAHMLIRRLQLKTGTMSGCGSLEFALSGSSFVSKPLYLQRERNGDRCRVRVTTRRESSEGWTDDRLLASHPDAAIDVGIALVPGSGGLEALVALRGAGSTSWSGAPSWRANLGEGAPKSGGLTITPLSGADGTPCELRFCAPVAGVQSLGGIGVDVDPWRLIFPCSADPSDSTIAADAPARIVSISPPIKMFGKNHG